ncbi:MAG: lytic transglycosylase domain-containing protein [Marmoricola sp.]
MQLPSPQLRVPTALANSQAKRVLVASSIAVAATGVAVTTGVAGSAAGPMQLAAAKSTAAKDAGAAILADRAPQVSRSLDRQALARTVKAAALSSTSGAAVTGSVHLNPVATAATGATVSLAPSQLKALTISLMPSFGFSTSDFSCIDQIWTQESGWNVHAANPSGAYGIPQALPGSKMASAGPDWQNNATTQIKWGLGYIKASYGTPCNAAAFKLAHGWY